jgi:hypothetical protein
LSAYGVGTFGAKQDKLMPLEDDSSKSGRRLMHTRSVKPAAQD